MKILWLCNIMLPQIATSMSKSTGNGGGWLVGLSNDLLQQKDTELIVCCPIKNEKEIIEGNIGKLKYYAFPQRKSDFIVYDDKYEEYFKEILLKEKPEIIHIFGTEYPHSLAIINICEKLGLINKVIVNIQGLVSIYEKHYYANIPNEIVTQYTIRDFLKNDNIRQQRKKFKKRGEFELKALAKVKHVIGRTDWDKACIEHINPYANYYFCNETLRDEFYKKKWCINKCDRYSIFVTQYGYPIKGFHYMLEAMPYILKKYPKAHIYITGSNPMDKNFKNKLKLSSYQKYIRSLILNLDLENHITFVGGLSEIKMCEQFLKSHVFVSPSSIENSPNSVGEAMILGVPTVSSDVGGVKNMLTHDVDGIVYQTDAPYMLAHYVCEIFNDDNLSLKFSSNSKKHANITHNREKNLQKMLEIYKDVIN